MDKPASSGSFEWIIGPSLRFAYSRRELLHVYSPPENSKDIATMKVIGSISQRDCFVDRKGAATMPANRIMNSGQRAYVEPQSCCERKAPFTVPIKM